MFRAIRSSVNQDSISVKSEAEIKMSHEEVMAQVSLLWGFGKRVWTNLAMKMRFILVAGYETTSSKYIVFSNYMLQLTHLDFAGGL